MKTIKMNWGITIEQFGIGLLFATKKEAIATLKDLEQYEFHYLRELIQYCHRNHITYSYLIKPK